MAQWIWLDGPYSGKDEAKGAGARWRPASRRWYAPRPGIQALELLPGEDRSFVQGLSVDLVPSSCWFTNVRSCVAERDEAEDHLLRRPTVGGRCDHGRMDLAWLPSTLSTFGTVGAVSAITSYLIGRRQQATTMRVADVQSSTQLSVARLQFEVQAALDREQFVRQKTAEAYGELMTWLRHIEEAVEEIYGHILEQGADHRNVALNLILQWQWDHMRRPPAEAARVRLYWSERVNELVGAMRDPAERLTITADAANRATAVMDDRYVLSDLERMPIRYKFIEARLRLLEAIDDIRMAARAEMRGD